ncbi:MAG: lamin tail domain-containing protein [Akkermansiaceae bacterium]
MIKPSVYPRWAERPFGKAFQRILGENSRVFAGFRYGFWVFCLLLGAPVAKSQMLVISEFMASNQSGLRDEDGDDEDWIEIYNPGNSSVNLAGWYLTDDRNDLTKWTFPELALEPSQSLVVFASDKDRKVSGAELHTNFKLSTSGEYLGIIRPDGVTVEQDYGPAYPIQVTNVSYGLKQQILTETLAPLGSDATYLVPSNSDYDVQDGANLDSWIGTNFDDSLWISGATPHGYGQTNNDQYYDVIATDLREELYTKKTTVYIRIPFLVEDPLRFTTLRKA